MHHLVALALVFAIACGGDDESRRLPDAPPFGAVTLSVMPGSVSIVPGGAAMAMVTIVREGGFEGAVDIGVDGATAMVTATGGTIAAGETTLALQLSADAAATSSLLSLDVTGAVPGLTIAPAPLEVRIAGQLGGGIPGEAAGDMSGVVALSRDGTRLVIGAPFNDEAGVSAGHARVFEWNGSAWVQLGADIDGVNPNDRLGGAVAISANGTRIALGAYNGDGPTLLNTGSVRVLDWNGTAWMPVGANIDGPVSGAGFGRSVALSATGDRLVLGAPANNSVNGKVYVYELVAGAWTQVGTEIGGDHTLGTDVDISDDGSRMVLSAPSAQSSDGYPGRVQVYELVAGEWIALGAPLMGEQMNDYFGGSVSLSGDGTTLAVGAEGNNGAGANAGNLRVFAWDGTAWTQIGPDLEPPVAGIALGTSVSISDDGARVVAGGPVGVGRMLLFERSGATYVQPPAPSFGTSQRTGEYVAISGNGRVAAVGAIYALPTGSASGETRVFMLP